MSINIRLTGISYALLLFCFSASAQKSDRDSTYYKEERKVTRELQKENPNECLRIYMALNKKYKLSTTSVYEFRNIAMANQDSAAFIESGRLHILYSADSVKNFVNQIEPDFDIKKYPKLAGAYRQLKSEEGALINKARMTLNFKWIGMLNYFIGFDQGFRNSGREAFKTIDSFYYFMVQVDSTNLAEMSVFIKENGFPTMSELGLEWGKLQPLLHHIMAITFTKEKDNFEKATADKCRADFLGFWPQLYAATVKGEFNPSFYDYVYSYLETNYKKNNLDDDLKFLQQYKPVIVFE